MVELPPRSGRIHIMHVVPSGFAGGGMENGIVNVANRLPVERYRISVCALDSRETFSKRVVRLDSEYHLLPKRRDGIDWSLIWRLARLFRCAKVDLVHSHNWGTFLYAVLASKLAGVPIIHGEHGKNQAELTQSRLKKWTKSLLGRRVDRLVTVSRALANEWTDYGVPAKNVQYVPNGVDTERFQPCLEKEQARAKFGLPTTGLVIGGIGRFDALKNYEILVVAFAKIGSEFPSLHLALLGQGPCEQRLRDKAKHHGVANRVSFIGWRPDPEVFLSALDVFVLPSKFEGMSNVVLEAMATGLPVVCADLPTHRDVFDPEKEGILISPCTAETLAGILAALLRDPERRRSLGSAARNKMVQQFSIAQMVFNYERLYADYVCPGTVVDPLRQEMPNRV